MHFGRGHYEEHFYEIVINFGQMSLKDISIFSSGCNLFCGVRRFCAILVEDNMSIIPVNYFKFGLVVQEDMSLKEKKKFSDRRLTKTGHNSSA